MAQTITAFIKIGNMERNARKSGNMALAAKLRAERAAALSDIFFG
jgi:hypothetical protein